MYDHTSYKSYSIQALMNPAFSQHLWPTSCRLILLSRLVGFLCCRTIHQFSRRSPLLCPLRSSALPSAGSENNIKLHVSVSNLKKTVVILTPSSQPKESCKVEVSYSNDIRGKESWLRLGRVLEQQSNKHTQFFRPRSQDSTKIHI